jgi:hypothetical protein
MAPNDLDAMAKDFADGLTERLKAANMMLLPRDLVGKAFLAVLLGEKMREAQRRYFRTRSREDLVASKIAEHAFDHAVAALDGAHRPAPDA